LRIRNKKLRLRFLIKTQSSMAKKKKRKRILPDVHVMYDVTYFGQTIERAAHRFILQTRVKIWPKIVKKNHLINNK